MISNRSATTCPDRMRERIADESWRVHRRRRIVGNDGRPSDIPGGAIERTPLIFLNFSGGARARVPGTMRAPGGDAEVWMPSPIASLTAAEAEVARLASEGGTNAQIAR